MIRHHTITDVIVYNVGVYIKKTKQLNSIFFNLINHYFLYSIINI